MGTYQVGADGKAPKGLRVGDSVVTQGGTYYIKGINDDGSYQSVAGGTAGGNFKVGADGKAPTGLRVGDNVVTGGGTYSIKGLNDDGTYQSILSNAGQTTDNYKGAYGGDMGATTYNYQDDYSIYTGYEPQQQALLNQQLNYGQFSYGDAPTYNNRYDDIIQGKLSEINNQQPFNQDVRESDLYAAYKQQATREADRSYRDTMGAASALTGGQVSSGAQAAASQARNYQMSQLNDNYGEIYNTLYSQYLNDFNMKLSQLEATQGQEQIDYQKFLNDLSQHNVDKGFAYGAYTDKYNMLGNNLNTVNSMAGNKWERDFTTQQTNYEKGLNEFDRNLAMAQLGAQFMDYDKLKEMGIDTSAYEAALAASSYSSGGRYYSGGSSSGGSSGSSKTSNTSGYSSQPTNTSYSSTASSTSSAAEANWIPYKQKLTAIAGFISSSSNLTASQKSDNFIKLALEAGIPESAITSYLNSNG